MAINNRHDFHAFSALRGSDLRSATFGHNERCVDEAFCFIERAAVAKFVGTSSRPGAELRCSTKSEIADAQFCSSDSFAAACAIAHRC